VDDDVRRVGETLGREAVLGAKRLADAVLNGPVKVTGLPQPGDNLGTGGPPARGSGSFTTSAGSFPGGSGPNLQVVPPWWIPSRIHTQREWTLWDMGQQAIALALAVLIVPETREWVISTVTTMAHEEPLRFAQLVAPWVAIVGLALGVRVGIFERRSKAEQEFSAVCEALNWEVRVIRRQELDGDGVRLTCAIPHHLSVDSFTQQRQVFQMHTNRHVSLKRSKNHLVVELWPVQEEVIRYAEIGSPLGEGAGPVGIRRFAQLAAFARWWGDWWRKVPVDSADDNVPRREPPSANGRVHAD